jgi:hypothetical protein
MRAAPPTQGARPLSACASNAMMAELPPGPRTMDTSNKRFAQALEDRGLRFQKRHGERGYWGLRLREPAQQGDRWDQPGMPF